jgi:hypothetical protein
MGILDGFFGGGQGGGLLGGFGEKLRDVAPIMSAIGNNQDIGTAQFRVQQMQARRQQQQEEEFQKQAAAALAQKMGLPPELASSPESVFSLARSMKLAEEERKNRRPERLSMTEQWLQKLRQDDPVKFQQIMEREHGGGSDRSTPDMREFQAAQENPAFGKYLESKRGTQDRVLANDRVAINKAEDAIPEVDGTIQRLNRALELNGDPDNQKPPQVETGMGAGTMGYLGSRLPDWMVPGDAQKQTRTNELQTIMSKEAIQEMSQALTGATTNFELQKFEALMSDPSQPPQIKAQAIKQMLAKAELKKRINQARINQMRAGGGYYKPGGGALSDPVQAQGDPGQQGTPKRLRYNPQTGALE